MKLWHKRALLAGTVLAVGTTVLSQDARAILGLGDIVFCTNCSDAWTQVAQLGKEAATYTQTVQSYVRQGLQYANQIQNTVSLPMQVWGTAQGDLSAVRGTMSGGSMFGSGGINGVFGTAQSYGGQLGSLAMMPSKYAQWGSMSSNSLDSTLKLLGLTDKQNATDNTNWTTIQTQSATATGQVQAIQAGNEMAAANGRQLQRLQETVAAQTQMQANQIALTNDRQAIADAAATQFLSSGPMSTTGGLNF
jgi:type IV secretion system protein TrbJ